MSHVILMRRPLNPELPTAPYPPGYRLADLSEVDPRDLHAILAAAYENGYGSVPDFEAWWTGLTADHEFDPDLVFIATFEGRPVGVCQCWTSAFIKDLAVHHDHRGKGVAMALLQAAFAAFAARGHHQVELKVQSANTTAIGLYRKAGMVAV